MSLDVGEIGRVCVKWTKLLTDYSRRLIIEQDCGVKTKASNTIQEKNNRHLTVAMKCIRPCINMAKYDKGFNQLEYQPGQIY